MLQLSASNSSTASPLCCILSKINIIVSYQKFFLKLLCKVCMRIIMAIITDFNITVTDVLLRYNLKQLLFTKICDLLGIGCNCDKN